MRFKFLSLFICLFVYSETFFGQSILPTPMSVKLSNSNFSFKKSVTIAYDKQVFETAEYLAQRLRKHTQINLVEGKKGDVVLTYSMFPMMLGNEEYTLKINEDEIKIVSGGEAGMFYGVQSLLQLLPMEVQAEKPLRLAGIVLEGIKVEDYPKYVWRSFMLDSGRQYQSPEFIKKYLGYMAMLKMNVFHWHLTEGQGWRIEIKKYPKLVKIGSKVAKGKEQQGYYTQNEIRDIVAYAKKLHIMVVPEIDVPGHSEAALISYPEMTCSGKLPKTVMGFSSNLFCGGSEKTYEFIEDILDEVCDLFPSQYIHLGGDEAPKASWNQCSACQSKIKEEHLKDSDDLQLYFSSRLASYLKTKGKKTIFWGDVVYNEGTILPDNVVIQWWNSNGHEDLALKNAIKRGHQVICNTREHSYLNHPLSPWKRYKKNSTFDLKIAYEENKGDIENPHELVLGMGACIWTDWHVLEDMIDQRVFPRIYALAEQMWHKGKRKSFNDFYKEVKTKYPLLKALGIDYGPALTAEVPVDYKWD